MEPGSRILIVDDEADLVDACIVVLEEEGYRVRGITDGRKALAAARDEEPDLVLLDWVMPGIDGGMVLAQLRDDARTAGIPVLMLSALPDGAARAAGAGADAFLAKPFDAEQLTRKVNELCAREDPAAGELRSG